METVTEKLLDYARDIAREADARAIVVYADVFPEPGRLGEFLKDAGETDVVLVTRRGLEDCFGAEMVKVPDVKLTRMGQLKIAILLGLSQGLFSQGDRLVCLTGIAETGILDTIVFMEVAGEFEMFASKGASQISERVRPEVVEAVLDIAISLGNEGREGKPVGTTFVLGDAPTVREHSQPMILNPFKGYTPAERSILSPEVRETVKEFSTIDGAFLIDDDGTVEAAGVFLKTEDQSVEIPRGLGTRHRSAAAITALTDAIAVTVSESSGNVTVYREGKVVMEIEKPRPIGRETVGQREFFGRREPGVDVETEEGEG